jgi:O-antigen ligase
MTERMMPAPRRDRRWRLGRRLGAGRRDGRLALAGSGNTRMKESSSRTWQAHSRRYGGLVYARSRSTAFHALISFETVFLLFVFAGQYKGFPELNWFPVDMTALFFLLSITVALLIGATRVNVISALEERGAVLFVLFIVWVVISILWSSFSVENKTKVIYSATLTLWSFFGAYLFVSRSWFAVRRFLIGVVVISVLLLLYWGYHRFILGIALFGDLEDSPTSYQEYGFHAQYLVSALIALTIASRSAIRSLASALGLVTVFVIMLFIGSRAPLLFGLASVPLALLMLLRRHRVRSLTFLVSLSVAAALLITVALWASGPEAMYRLGEQMTTLERLQTYREPAFGSSMAQRIDGQLFALARWLEAPVMGWGIGEFALMHDYLQYPHNLFLEILVETGFVGLCLLIALAGLGVVRAWRLWPADRSNWTAMTLVLLYANELMLRSTVQGFLSEERMLFVLLGLILGIAERAPGRTAGSP